MRIFVLTILAVSLPVWAANSSDEQQRAGASDEHKKANMSAYFDVLAVNIKKVLEERCTPMEIPDTMLRLNVIGLPVELGFKNGELNNLSHLRRDGEATLDYQNHSLLIDVPLVFNDLVLYYDLVATVLDIGPKAGTTVDVDQLEVHLELEVDLEQQKVHLKDLQLNEVGEIKVHVKGFLLLDPFIDIIADVVVSVFKRFVLKVVELRVREVAQNAIDSIDLSSIINS